MKNRLNQLNNEIKELLSDLDLITMSIVALEDEIYRFRESEEDIESIIQAKQEEIKDLEDKIILLEPINGQVDLWGGFYNGK